MMEEIPGVLGARVVRLRLFCFWEVCERTWGSQLPELCMDAFRTPNLFFDGIIIKIAKLELFHVPGTMLSALQELPGCILTTTLRSGYWEETKA